MVLEHLQSDHDPSSARSAVAELEPRFPEAAALLAEAREKLLAFSHFDPEHWRQI